MRTSGRRLADPPFPRTVRLLGRDRPLTADPGMPWRDRRLVLAVLRDAAAKLETESATGRLSAEDRRYVGALKRFTLGRGRSGQWRGTFIMGLADVRASQDADYWSSALVHDGVHAHLQSRARRFWDEVGPREAQIGYLRRTCGPEYLVDAVVRFRDSRGNQRRRLFERV